MCDEKNMIFSEEDIEDELYIKEMCEKVAKIDILGIVDEAISQNLIDEEFVWKVIITNNDKRNLIVKLFDYIDFPGNIIIRIKDKKSYIELESSIILRNDYVVSKPESIYMAVSDCDEFWDAIHDIISITNTRIEKIKSASENLAIALYGWQSAINASKEVNLHISLMEDKNESN